MLLVFVTEGSFDYPKSFKSNSFPLLIVFLFATQGGFVMKDWAYLAFELMQRFSSISGKQVRCTGHSWQVSEVYNMIFCK